MAQLKHESDGIKMSVADEIRAWSLLNILDIMKFVMCATDSEISERYGTEETAIDIAEKYLNIGMKAEILQYPISGWSMKYSQPLKENPQNRVTHEAVFHTITEVDKDAESD